MRVRWMRAFNEGGVNEDNEGVVNEGVVNEVG